MNIDKLERANIIAKSLIPKIKELRNISSKSKKTALADSIYGLTRLDSEFRTKFRQLLSETEQRLQKEFEEL